MATYSYNPEQITPDRINYIYQEAMVLSQREAYAIENYVDREINNPDLREFLESQKELDMETGDGPVELTLSYEQQYLGLRWPDWLRFRFNALKRKVKRIFCKVVDEMRADKKIDWKKMIGAILVALVPAFGGGLPAIVLPIVIGLIAMLFKYGVGKVCPVE